MRNDAVQHLACCGLELLSCEAGDAHKQPLTHNDCFGVLMCLAVLLREVADLVHMIQGDIRSRKPVSQTVTTMPSLSRRLMLQWSDRVLTGRSGIADVCTE